MFHTYMISYLAKTVVIRWWQLTEHDSYQRDILPCSDRCHVTMATDVACFIHEWLFTMLWPLALDDDNWWSMLHTLGMYNNALSVVIRQRRLTEHVPNKSDMLHVLTVVMRWWQLREHDSYMNDILPCSVLCHETMIPDQAWFIP